MHTKTEDMLSPTTATKPKRSLSPSVPTTQISRSKSPSVTAHYLRNLQRMNAVDMEQTSLSHNLLVILDAVIISNDELKQKVFIDCEEDTIEIISILKPQKSFGSFYSDDDSHSLIPGCLKISTTDKG